MKLTQRLVLVEVHQRLEATLWEVVQTYQGTLDFFDYIPFGQPSSPKHKQVDLLTHSKLGHRVSLTMQSHNN